MNYPKVSIFTTCFNSGKYLKQTLNSILSQNLENIEIIIVDGGSNDETMEIIKTYKFESRIKFFVEPGINVYDGFISAFYKTSGTYVLCMPVSDLITGVSWLSTCTDILDNNIQISLVHGISVHNNDKGDIYFGKATRRDCPSENSFFSFWSATFFAFAEHTSCVRREVYKECIELDLPYNKKKFLSQFSNKRINSKNFFFNNFLKFTYNFNTRGYLPMYIPLVSSYVREHSGQAGQAAIDLDIIVANFYVDMIKNYREKISKGLIIHYFRDGNGKIIERLSGYKLKIYIKETINYRLYENIYFSSIDMLNKVGNSIQFKVKRLFSRLIRFFYYWHYKLFQILNIK